MERSESRRNVLLLGVNDDFRVFVDAILNFSGLIHSFQLVL